MCVAAGTGHVSSSYSCLEVLVALYHGGVLRVDPKRPDWAGRDRFILSKGQASPALYVVLADMGFFHKSDLRTFAQRGGRFGVHLQNTVPGVEATTGSLGIGFGMAAGLALAAKLNRELHLTFVMLGDGECYEGSVWETAMLCSHHRLNNLVAFLDRNYLCATDFTENLLRLEPLAEKWRSFGWDVVCIDGHSHRQIAAALGNVRSRRSTHPLMIIADTVKGKGIDPICYDPLWHAVTPTGDQVGPARRALRAAGPEEE